jgi:hypothetical protein
MWTLLALTGEPIDSGSNIVTKADVSEWFLSRSPQDSGCYGAKIRRNGLLGTETGKALWEGMVTKFCGDFKLLRFAESTTPSNSGKRVLMSFRTSMSEKL